MTTTGRQEQIAGVAALDQPLRRALYDLIRDSGEWVGRDEAADALDVPRSVAAFHLDKLADAGLLEVRFERPAGRSGPGAGRPAKLYRPSRQEISISVPERQYVLAGVLLADAVQDSAASGRPVNESLARCARAAGVEAGIAAREALPRRKTRRELRRAVTGALRRLGYEPRETRKEIRLANCPFHQLAEHQRLLICTMNLDLIAGLAEGLGVQKRYVPQLDPEPGMCCVRIESAEG